MLFYGIVLGGRYVNFGEYFEECVDNCGKSISLIAKRIGINRGGLYHVFKESRKIKSDDLFAVIKFIGLSPEKEKKLVNLYFSEYYGKAQYERILLLKNCIQSLKPFEQIEKEDIGEFNKSFILKNEDEVISAVDFVINKSEGGITTNYSFEQKRIDSLFYYSVQNQKISEFKHIVAIEKDNCSELVKTIFDSMKFLYYQYFPFFTYVSQVNCQMDIYPYFVLSGKYVVLYNNDDGIFIDNDEAVLLFMQKVKLILNNCGQFGSNQGDILDVKNRSVQFATDEEVMVFDNHPYIGLYQDLELFENLAQPNLENKQVLVQIAHEHYKDISENSGVKNYLTLGGIDDFIHYGNVTEIPKKMKTPLSKKQLYKAAVRLYKAFDNESACMLDNEKFSFSSDFSFEANSDTVFFLGSNSKSSDFCTGEVFFAKIENVQLAEMVKNFGEYLQMSKSTFSKNIALAHMRNRIAGLRAMLDD